MKDMFGRPLTKGDTVLWGTTRGLRLGWVTKIADTSFPLQVRILYPPKPDSRTGKYSYSLKRSDMIVKVGGIEL